MGHTDFDLKLLLTFIGRWYNKFLVSWILFYSAAFCLIRSVNTIIDIVTSWININTSSIATSKLIFWTRTVNGFQIGFLKRSEKIECSFKASLKACLKDSFTLYGLLLHSKSPKMSNSWSPISKLSMVLKETPRIFGLLATEIFHW